MVFYKGKAMFRFTFLLLLAVFLLITACSLSRDVDNEKPHRDDAFHRETRTVPPLSLEPFSEDRRYHSRYHTENPYYDGRNRILDGDYEGALELLEADPMSLEYPDRAALWVFLLKTRLGRKVEARKFLEAYQEGTLIPVEDQPSNGDESSETAGTSEAPEEPRDDQDKKSTPEEKGASDEETSVTKAVDEGSEGAEKESEKTSVDGVESGVDGVESGAKVEEKTIFSDVDKSEESQDELAAAFDSSSGSGFEDVLALLIEYYLGTLDEDSLKTFMIEWDEIDNCTAYYYFGMYKKYFENDPVTGNDYLSRSYRTGMSEQSEYKLAETEIRGFTDRNPGQYVDFPMDMVTANKVIPEDIMGKMPTDIRGGDESSALPSSPSGRKGKNRKVFPLAATPSVITDEVGTEEYLVPSLDGMGSWETVSRKSLLTIIRDEAVSYIEFRMGNKNFFTLESNRHIQYQPISGVFKTYSESYEDYISDPTMINKDYGLDEGTVSKYLKEGDFLSGILVTCRTYNK